MAGEKTLQSRADPLAPRDVTEPIQAISNARDNAPQDVPP